MKTFILLLCILFTNYSFAQLAIINDADGFVNVRTSPEMGNNIQKKLKNGTLIYAFEPQGNWLPIDYQDGSGYIYKDRIKFLSSFTDIPIAQKEETKVVLKKGDISVTLSMKDFLPSKHKLEYGKGGNAPFLIKIDGKEILGTDGNIPQKQYDSITIQKGNTQISLKDMDFANLFEPNLDDTVVNYDETQDILYISSLNSDGAGGYFVVWAIEKGILTRKYVGHGF
jgi:hypothetical protein